VTLLDGTELAGKAYTTPEEILAQETDNKKASHGTHCAATAAGSTFDWAGGMAPDADLVICPFSLMDQGVEDNVNDLAYRVMQSILYIRDYAKRAGKPYIISMSLNRPYGNAGKTQAFLPYDLSGGQHRGYMGRRRRVYQIVRKRLLRRRCHQHVDGRLFIDGAEDGIPIRIYTTGGRLVAAAPLMGGSVSLPVGSPAGVYAVQVGTLGSTLIRK
jgi:hypothetical protein